MNRNDFIVRQTYLDKLIARRNNGDVKIITGPRRCGKSWLLSHIYKNYLVTKGAPSDKIISVDIYKDDDRFDFDILNVEELKKYIYGSISDESKEYIMFYRTAIISNR